jgi:hypothetical protein
MGLTMGDFRALVVQRQLSTPLDDNNTKQLWNYNKSVVRLRQAARRMALPADWRDDATPLFENAVLGSIDRRTPGPLK